MDRLVFPMDRFVFPMDRFVFPMGRFVLAMGLTTFRHGAEAVILQAVDIASTAWHAP